MSSTSPPDPMGAKLISLMEGTWPANLTEAELPDILGNRGYRDTLLVIAAQDNTEDGWRTLATLANISIRERAQSDGGFPYGELALLAVEQWRTGTDQHFSAAEMASIAYQQDQDGEELKQTMLLRQIIKVQNSGKTFEDWRIIISNIQPAKTLKFGHQLAKKNED